MTSGSPSSQGQPVLPAALSVPKALDRGPTVRSVSDLPGATDIQTGPVRRSTESFYIVLTGNPNCGKTTLFNALTGLRAKVGNYAGVTVERKEGRMLGGSREDAVNVLDLP